MNQIRQYYAYLFGSLAFSIGIQMVLPFPYGLIAALAGFMAFPFLLRRYQQKTGGYMERVKMAKTCTVCGKGTKGSQCPRCGSKQFKMS